MDWDLFISSTLTLLFILDPLGNAPPTQSVLQGTAPARRRWILLRETFFMIVLLLLFFFLGNHILRHFGFSEGALNISGGILLLLIAVGLIFPKISVMEDESPAENEPAKGEPFLVPITVPLVVGPAAIAFVMLQASLCRTAAETLGYMFSIIIACSVTGGTLAVSEHVMSRLGKNFSTIMARLMGTLLVLLAVQMCLNGITSYVQSLNTLLPVN